jgi:hypothetical protein
MLDPAHDCTGELGPTLAGLSFFDNTRGARFVSAHFDKF